MYNQKKAKRNLIITSVVIFILLFVPYIGDVLRTFNTFIHESGHAIAALLTGGKVDEIELYRNTEGVAATMLNGNIASIIVSLAGYVSSTLVMVFMFWMITKQKYNLLFYGITLLSVINLVLWIRNIYGFVWVTALVVGLCYVLYKKKEWIEKTLYGMLIIITIASTKGVMDILLLSYQTPTEAGDATSLASSTFLPPIVWGVFFFAQHIVGFWFMYKINKKRNENKSFKYKA